MVGLCQSLNLIEILDGLVAIEQSKIGLIISILRKIVLALFMKLT